MNSSAVLLMFTQYFERVENKQVHLGMASNTVGGLKQPGYNKKNEGVCISRTSDARLN